MILLCLIYLYADDTIVLVENACELQKALVAVHDYCGMYKLTVNIKKIKIIVCSRRKVKRFPTFKYGDNTIEVVSDYIYLGITKKFSNKFNKAIKKIDQGRKALFSMLVITKKNEHTYWYRMQTVWEIGFPIIVIWLWKLGFSLYKYVRDFL